MEKRLRVLAEAFKPEQLIIHRDSILLWDDLYFSLGVSGSGRYAVLFSDKSFTPLLEAPVSSYQGIHYQAVPWGWETYQVYSEKFPWLKPALWSGKGLSFGFGERCGFLSTAHISVAKKYDLFPILSQQSVRELSATGRTHRSLVADVAFSVFREGFQRGYGADGDHLKSLDHLKSALESGVTLVTLDLSEYLDSRLASAPESEVVSAYERLPEDYRREVESRYLDRSYSFSGGRILYTSQNLKRSAALYFQALNFITQVAEEIKKTCTVPPVLEVSVDELPFKTTFEEHLFLMLELEKRGIKPGTLAVRFPCLLEKGVDYLGNVEEAVEHFRGHFGITEMLGGYRLSIHSGSDKFSLFGPFARESGGNLHVKTAGTSWLELLSVICRKDWDFFLEIYKKARNAFPELKKKYSLSSSLEDIPEELPQNEASRILEKDRGVRQLLHVSYPAFLGDPQEKMEFWSFYLENRESCEQGIASHLDRHIRALGL